MLSLFKVDDFSLVATYPNAIWAPHVIAVEKQNLRTELKITEVDLWNDFSEITTELS